MIYVLGSINYDLVASVPYMPINGETLSADKFYSNTGGKGANQAVAIAKLGEKVKMIGKVGNDAFGKDMRENIMSYGVDTTFIETSDAPSGTAMIIIENGDNRIILNKGANYDIKRQDVDRGLFEAKEGDYLVMQLEIPMEIVEYATLLAKQKGMKVVLNPAPAKPLTATIYNNIDIICPNESETKILTDVDIVDEVHLALAVKKFYSFGVKQVVITAGSEGAYVTQGMEITHIPPQKVKVVDTTSAGDTFIGAMTVMLSRNKNIVEAGNFASVASSITIGREGAAKSIPTIYEVEEAIKKIGQ